MFRLPIWDEATHPDVTDVALKGEPLAMMAKSLDDMQAMFDLSRTMREKLYAHPKVQEHGDKAGMLEDADMALSASRRVIDSIRKVLTNSAVQKHGIDIRDFKQIVATLVVDPNYDTEQYIQEKTERLEKLSTNPASPDVRHTLTDQIENDIAISLVGSFSAALAIQTGREKEYNTMIDEEMRDTRELLMKTAIGVKERGDDKEASGFIAGNTLMQVMGLQAIQMERESGNPLVDFHYRLMVGEHAVGKKDIGGSVDVNRDAMAYLKGWDRDLHGDERQVLAHEQKVSGRMCEVLGIKPTLPPDQAGAIGV